MSSRTILFATSLLFFACGDDSQPAETSSSSGGGSTSLPDPSSSSTDVAADSSTSTDPPNTSSSGESSSSGGDALDCSDRPTDRPTARGEIDGVWDPAGERMVFFGGDQGTPVQCMSQTDFVAETWAFHPDCDNFERIAGDGGPPPRGRHAVAHDPGRNWMLIHGGRFRDGTSGAYTLYDDVWALDLATDAWVQVAAGGPPARTNHTAVVSGDRMIIFGGNTSTSGLQFNPLNDLWALDLNDGTWTEIEATDGPSPRLFHDATVSADGTTMFVHGGGDESAFTGPFFGDLWQLDLRNETWTLLDDSSDVEPLRTIWGDLLFDAARDQLVLWGAHEDNVLGNANKIWTYDLGGGGWTMQAEGDVLQSNAAGFCDFPADFVDPDLDAPERRNAGAAVLAGEDTMLVFGGKTDCGIIDDVWARDLSSGAWERRVRATEGEICVRAFAEGCRTMCF